MDATVGVTGPVEHTTQLALHEKAKLKKSLRRFDMLFFLICAFVGLDTLGLVASSGGEGFTWLIVLAIAFVLPYALVMAEVGSAFTQEGGPYEWVKLAFGRFHAGMAAVFYWITNPLWVGGSLAFIATEAWNTGNHFPDISGGSAGDYAFKLLFVWFSIGVAIAALSYGKWIPTAGGFARIIVLGFFTFTVVLYAIEHGVHGISGGDLSPSMAVFLGLVPYLLFNYVGFELPNGAAEEMVNPQHDVPVSVIRSAVAGVLLYAVPIFGILIVLPASAITNIGGFIDAIQQVFTVYGGASDALFDVMALLFIFTLMTSGAVWMIGSDRIQAVAAYDGAFAGFFGVFNRKLGTPVRVNVLSGVVASAFTIAAIQLLNNTSTADAFTVVLDIAISTTLISYLWIFPAAAFLRRRYPEVHRPYRVPFGTWGIWAATALITFWVALGSWVAVFPSTLEKVFGIDYNFEDNWGVSMTKFLVLTLGTLAVVVAIALVGYVLGAPVRRREVEVLIEAPDSGSLELEGAPVLGTTT
ncbi:MAG TPA: APC family permease [Gaiellaceae bacterium]|nr:APC family permease [Gaiellaceae bacterium]